ncbi:MAG: O-antigen ligase family protein, partial [Bacteroidota bacterium]
MRPSSAEARLLIWRVTKEMITDKLALGIGYGNYATRYMDYQARFFASPENVRTYSMVAGNVKYADNDFLQIFAELGIVGTTVFVVLLAATHIRSYERLQSEELSERAEHYLMGAMGSMTAFIVISFFTFPFHIAPTAVTFFVMFAAVTAVTANKFERWQGVLLNRATAIVLVAILILIVYDIPRKISAYEIWDEAFGLSLSGNYRDAIDKYRSVYDRLDDSGKFHFMLGGTYATVGMYREAIEELERSRRDYNDPKIYVALGVAHEKLGNYNEAEKNYLIASRMMPHWMYPHYLMAKLYYEHDDFLK